MCYYSVQRTKKNKFNEVTTYLDCHRTGIFQSKSTGVRKIKSQGTNRIGFTCPSSMVTTFLIVFEKYDIRVSIIFY